MAFARRGTQQAITQNATAGNTLSLSLPGAATATDSLIVQVSTTENAPGTTGVTDNQSGNTYTRDIVGSALNSSGAHVGIYSCGSINASGTFTVTYSTIASANIALALSEYSGGPTSLDKTAGGGSTTNTNNETTSTTPLISSATSLAIAAMTHDDAAETFQTNTVGYSTVVNNGSTGATSVSMVMSDRIISSAAAQVCTWTTNAVLASHYDACIATYQVGAASTTGPIVFYSHLASMGVM